MNCQLRIIGLLSFAIVQLLACDGQTYPYHPQLVINLVQSKLQNEIMLATEKSIEGNTIKVLNDACTLSVSFIRSQPRDSIPMIVIIKNTVPESDGGFHGVWTIPDSLLVFDTIKVFGCIYDLENERSCDEQTLPVDDYL